MCAAVSHIDALAHIETCSPRVDLLYACRIEDFHDGIYCPVVDNAEFMPLKDNRDIFRDLPTLRYARRLARPISRMQFHGRPSECSRLLIK
jgi:hypothetical protein